MLSTSWMNKLGPFPPLERWQEREFEHYRFEGGGKAVKNSGGQRRMGRKSLAVSLQKGQMVEPQGNLTFQVVSHERFLILPWIKEDASFI